MDIIFGSVFVLDALSQFCPFCSLLGSFLFQSWQPPEGPSAWLRTHSYPCSTHFCHTIVHDSYNNISPFRCSMACLWRAQSSSTHLPPMMIICTSLVPFIISSVSRRWRKFGGNVADVWRKKMYFSFVFNDRCWFDLWIKRKKRKKTIHLAEEEWFHVTRGPFRRQTMMPQSPQT